jgi:N-acetylneuraminic acid mutarotase
MEENKGIDSQQISLHVNTNSSYNDTVKHIWEEVRTANNHPSRRSYHSAVMWKEKMVIFGGQDLREGPQAGLWTLEISQFDQGEWEESGIVTEPLCRHSAVIKNDLMYVFAGTDGNNEYNTTIVINLSTSSVRKIIPDNKSTPPPLDSHSAVLYEDGTACWMIVFGGFAVGQRVSSVYSLNLNNEKWKLAHTTSGPRSRSNHSAVVYKEHMFTFGGTNDEGEKMNDMWKLDLRTYAWEELRTSGDVPSSRSGHSAVMFNDLMIVFGGMKDITKETNDMYTFNIESNTWVLCQFEHQIRDPVSNEQLEEFKKSRISPNKLKVDPSNRSPSRKSTNEVSPNKILKKSENNSPDAVSGPKKRKTLYDGPASPVTGRIRTHPPHPRDGHSAVISNSTMIIFGGDRHQMPFNDTYVYFLIDQTLRTPVRQ